MKKVDPFFYLLMLLGGIPLYVIMYLTTLFLSDTFGNERLAIAIAWISIVMYVYTIRTKFMAKEDGKDEYGEHNDNCSCRKERGNRKRE